MKTETAFEKILFVANLLAKTRQASTKKEQKMNRLIKLKQWLSYVHLKKKIN